MLTAWLDRLSSFLSCELSSLVRRIAILTTVAILDRFLQVEVGSVSRNKLELVGVAAMLVAAKYEEIYAPEVKNFVFTSQTEGLH